MTLREYYQDATVTLYCGKCEDVMPELNEQFDMIFTSPPYNLGTTTGGGFGHYADGARWNSRGGGGKWTGGALAEGYDGHDDAMPMPEYEKWQQECLTLMWDRLTDKGAIYYNHKPRPQRTLWSPFACNPGLPLRQIVTWARAGGVNFNPTYYLPTYEWIMIFAKEAWRLKSKGASSISDVWRVPQQASAHPAPFPVALPAMAIETANPRNVLDPFCGSGSTLRAAKDAGVRAVGIEKSEAYCRMTVERLRQSSIFEVIQEPML